MVIPLEVRSLLVRVLPVPSEPALTISYSSPESSMREVMADSPLDRSITAVPYTLVSTI